MKRKVFQSKLIIILAICLFILPTQERVNAFSNQVIQQGSVGDDVIELQSRLQYLGFYNGKIDGAFGWGTYWGLRNFQYEFGLPIDGLAGQTTKNKLVKASKYNGQINKIMLQNQVNSEKIQQQHRSRVNQLQQMSQLDSLKMIFN